MKYKQNCKIILKSYNLLVRQYGKTLACGAYFVPNGLIREMEKSKTSPMYVEICSIGSREYRVRLKNRDEYSFITDEMILGDDFEHGEKIRVSQDKRIWCRKHFSRYYASGEVKTTDGNRFAYCRRLPKT